MEPTPVFLPGKSHGQRSLNLIWLINIVPIAFKGCTRGIHRALCVYRLEVIGIVDFLKRFMGEIVFGRIREPDRKGRNGWPGRGKRPAQRKRETPDLPCRCSEDTYTFEILSPLRPNSGVASSVKLSLTFPVLLCISRQIWLFFSSSE